MASSLSTSRRAMGSHMLPFPVSTGPRRPHILLGASGSVAAIKFEHLCRSFTGWADVAAVVTKNAVRFIGRVQFPREVFLYTDEDEWLFWNKLGDPVLHIDLVGWADVLVIAPLSSNTLGKIAGGLCDNLLTSIVRAWDYEKPMFVAPSMNRLMWQNPLTERHIMSLDEMGINLIPPVHGTGAMAEISQINSTIRLYWAKKHNQAGTSGNG